MKANGIPESLLKAGNPGVLMFEKTTDFLVGICSLADKSTTPPTPISILCLLAYVRRGWALKEWEGSDDEGFALD